MTEKLSAFTSISPVGEATCPVCLRRLRKCHLGKPENCDHYFCFTCIHEWAKNVNTCPVDRIKFNFIEIYSGLGGKPLKREYIPDHNLIEMTFNHEDVTFCEVCNNCDREDSLLLCDGCDKGFHLDCLNPPLDEIPEGDWYCQACILIINEQFQEPEINVIDLDSDCSSNNMYEEGDNGSNDDGSAVEWRSAWNQNEMQNGHSSSEVEVVDSSETSNDEECENDGDTSEESSEDSLNIQRQRSSKKVVFLSSEEDEKSDKETSLVETRSDGQKVSSKMADIGSKCQQNSEDSDSCFEEDTMPISKRRRGVTSQRLMSDSDSNDEVNSKETLTGSASGVVGGAKTEGNSIKWRNITVPLTRLKWKIPRKQNSTATSANDEGEGEDVPADSNHDPFTDDQREIKSKVIDDKKKNESDDDNRELISSGYVILDDVTMISSQNTTHPHDDSNCSRRQLRPRANTQNNKNDSSMFVEKESETRARDTNTLSSSEAQPGHSRVNLRPWRTAYTCERTAMEGKLKRRRSQRIKMNRQHSSQNTWFDFRTHHDNAHSSSTRKQMDTRQVRHDLSPSKPALYGGPGPSSWSGGDPQSLANRLDNQPHTQLYPFSPLLRQSPMFTASPTTSSSCADASPVDTATIQPQPLMGISQEFSNPSEVSSCGVPFSPSPPVPLQWKHESSLPLSTSEFSKYSPMSSSSASTRPQRKRRRRRRRQPKLVLTMTKKMPRKSREQSSNDARTPKRRRRKARGSEWTDFKESNIDLSPRKVRLNTCSSGSANDPTYSPRNWDSNSLKSSERRMTRARTAATNTPRKKAMREAVMESYRHDNREEGLRFAREILAKQGRIASRWTPCQFSDDECGTSVTTPTKDLGSHLATPQSGFVYQSSGDSHRPLMSIPETPPSTMSFQHGIRPRPVSNSNVFTGINSPENRDLEQEYCMRVLDEVRRRSIPTRRMHTSVLVNPVQQVDRFSMRRRTSENEESWGDRSRAGRGSSGLIHQLCQNLDDLQNRNNIIQRDGSIVPLKEDGYSSLSSFPIDPVVSTKSSSSAYSMTSLASPSTPSISPATTPHKNPAHVNHQQQPYTSKSHDLDHTSTFQPYTTRSASVAMENMQWERRQSSSKLHTIQHEHSLHTRERYREDEFDESTTSATCYWDNQGEGMSRKLLLRMDRDSLQGRSYGSPIENNVSFIAETPTDSNVTTTFLSSPIEITSTTASVAGEISDPKSYVKRLLKQHFHLGNITAHQYTRILERASRKVEQGKAVSSCVDKKRIKRFIDDFVQAYVNANSEQKVM